MQLINRFKGALVGVTDGDARGAPYETWGPKPIEEDLARRGGLVYFDYPNPWTRDDNGATLPAGRPTDDSDQTADLCHSLLECNGIDHDHLRASLQNSVRLHVSRLWKGRATGAGGTTRDTLSDDPERVTRGLANTIGTNGSLMRCSPMALWFAGMQISTNQLEDNGSVRDTVYAMSRVTHAHPHAMHACWLYTKVLIRLLRGENGRGALETPTSFLEQRIKLRLSDDYDYPYDPGAWPWRGTAEFSLYIALYAFFKSTSYNEGIEMAVRVGGDTDTYAAIAGGLLGAYYGYEAIPDVVKRTALGHDKMVEYAEAIYNRRMLQPT